MSLEWIEGVPADWKVSESQFVLDFQKRDVKEGDEIVTAFRDGQVTLRSNRRTDGFTMADKEIGYQHICKGDLVVHSMDGGFGAIGVSDSCGKSSPVVHAYTSTSCDLRFVSYQLRAAVNAGWVAALAKGIRVRSTQFDRSALAGLKIAYANLEAQKRIADYLDRETAEIDAAVADLDRYVELLKKRRRAIAVSAIFPHGFPKNLLSAQSYLDLGYNSVIRIGAFAKLRKTRNSDQDAQYLSLMKGIGVILYEEKGNVGNKKPQDLSDAFVVEAGDYLINSMNFKIGSFGRSRYAGVTSGAYLIFSVDDNVVNPDFLQYVFENDDLRSQAQNLGNGILEHRKSINWDRFRSIYLPHPSREEQDAVVESLRKQTAEIDALVEESTKLRNLLLKRRSVLITEVVTGRKQV